MEKKRVRYRVRYNDYVNDESMAKLMTLLKSIVVDYNPLMAMMIIITK